MKTIAFEKRYKIWKIVALSQLMKKQLVAAVKCNAILEITETPLIDTWLAVTLY